jgi:hypothetical protein
VVSAVICQRHPESAQVSEDQSVSGDTFFDESRFPYVAPICSKCARLPMVYCQHTTKMRSDTSRYGSLFVSSDDKLFNSYVRTIARLDKTTGVQ